MWPFSKPKAKADGWLTPEQARAVTQVFYAEHDANCWYACARLPGGEGVRIATSSKEEAIELAGALVSEIAAKSGRSLAAGEGP